MDPEELLDLLTEFNRTELLLWLWHVLKKDLSAPVQDIMKDLGVSRKGAERAFKSLEESCVLYIHRDERHHRVISVAYDEFKLPETGEDIIPHLWVSKKAPREIIKGIYRFLCRKYHPDTAPEDKKIEYEEILKNITVAYSDFLEEA